MKNILLTAHILVICNYVSAQFQYLSPKPGSVMVNAEHNVLIREGSVLDAASIRPELFSIHDSKGREYAFKIALSDDQRTVILNPSENFGYREVITVSIKTGMRSLSLKKIPGYTFSFSTHPEYSPAQKENFRKMKAASHLADFGKQLSNPDESNLRDITGMFTLNVNTNPSPGAIFFDAFSGLGIINKFTGYHVITPQGDSVYSKDPVAASDFNLKQNGYPGFYNDDKQRFDVLDSNFNVIDNFYAVNGYDPDDHEFILLPDGHALFICDEYQVIDMTVYNPDYYDSCTVNSSVIQEFDASHNLVFEWRSFDYIEITEAMHVNLGASYVDFVHTNSIDIDVDGNIIASHRRMDQVTKINRNTGEFMWRLGGVMNEFTFINEPEPFIFQHDARRIANGNITLYDNGSYHPVPHSSAKEYQLDEVNMTATLVWSYTHPNPAGGNPLFYTALGNVQRLSNGNTFICWGLRNPGSTNPSMTEVTSNGTIVWELTLTTIHNMLSYRARKFEWAPCARPTLKKLKTEDITSQSARVKWANVANASKYTVQYKKHSEVVWTSKTVQSTKHYTNLNNLTADTKYDWRIQTKCTLNGTVTSGYTEIKKFTTLPLRAFNAADPPSANLIYPNPTADYFVIEGGSGWKLLRIFNLVGQQVMEEELSNSNEVESIAIGLHLAPGHYIAELSNNSERVAQKLVVE